jgi:hypothetical protein
MTNLPGFSLIVCGSREADTLSFSIYHVVFFCLKSFIILSNKVIARFEHCVLN